MSNTELEESAEIRRKKILDYLKAEGPKSVREVMEAFQKVEAVIRNDIYVLLKRGCVVGVGRVPVRWQFVRY